MTFTTMRITTIAAGSAGIPAVVGTGVVAWRVPDLQTVVDWLSSYPAIVVLLLITVTGEVVVLAAVIVAVEGSWSLAEVALWCFVGTVVSDAAWFGLAGVADERFLRRRQLGSRSERTLAWLRQRTGQRPYLVLLYVKFLYGSRFLMLVYLATRRVPLRQFLVYDGVGTLAWLAVLIPLGWLIARGLVTAANAGSLEFVGLAVIVVIVALRGGSAWLSARARQRSLPS